MNDSQTALAFGRNFAWNESLKLLWYFLYLAQSPQKPHATKIFCRFEIRINVTNLCFPPLNIQSLKNCFKETSKNNQLNQWWWWEKNNRFINKLFSTFHANRLEDFLQFIVTAICCVYFCVLDGWWWGENNNKRSKK